MDAVDPTVSLPPKSVADSKMMLAQVIFPKDTNKLGLATAGVILKGIDVAASLTAGKHSRKNIVTASLDRMDFLNPARLWELVSTQCRMTQTWHTSMEVAVAVEAENPRNGEKRHIAHAYLVFVALDEQFKPTPIPGLRLETEEERQRAQEAELRKANRKLEQAQLGKRHETAIDEQDNPEVMQRMMTPDDSNMHHNVFGGVILEMIHQAGERAAFRYVNGPVIAARQDRMSFEQPALIGEEVQASAVLTRTWKTSMEVQVDVVAGAYRSPNKRRVASSYLVFVAQDANGNPKPVPLFEPQTPKQVQRWEEAGVRRDIRLQEREAMRAYEALEKQP